MTLMGLVAIGVQAQKLVETQRQYLSGHGCDDMVQWDFLCSDGRNSGKWTKIGVPSCWELQGFGTYQYGHALRHLQSRWQCRYGGRSLPFP